MNEDGKLASLFRAGPGAGVDDLLLLGSYDSSVSYPDFGWHDATVPNIAGDAPGDRPEPIWNGSGATTTSVGATSNQDINGLLSGIRWTSTAMSYSFPTAGSQYGTYNTGSDEPATFQPVNATMKAAIQYALGQYAGISNLAFTQSAVGAEGNATLRFGMSDAAKPTAYAYYPSAGVWGGDVWFGTQTGGSAMTNPVKGNYAFHAAMHELGHALGLKHGQELGGPADTAMTAAHDAMEYSVMTYRSYQGASPTGGYTNEQWGYAQSLMMYDIAAIQTMYGADFSGPANTVYKWDPNTGQEFINNVGQGAPGGNRVFMTVWDGGGNATYDFSNYNTAMQIDLTPGGYSKLSSVQLAGLGNGNFAHGNVYNALQFGNDTRSLIRNVIVGNGNSSILGNSANNNITVGTGTNTIDGGLGRDTVVFNALSSAATITHNPNGTWTVAIAGYSDTLTNVEAIKFTDKTISFKNPIMDFNGDGMSDVLWKSASGGVSLWTMNGTQSTSNSFVGGDSAWSIAGTGDFNGDGVSDLLWKNNASGQIVEWTMNGAQPTASAFIGGDSNWSVVGTGDFNGDGKSDILWKNGASGQVVEWTMNGSQVTSSAAIGGNSNWSVVGTGDFNGDGNADILWRDGASGQVVEWAMNGSQVIGQQALGGDSNWSVVGIGDYNGDGTSDLLWRNGATGAVVEWAMNTTQMSAGGLGGDLSWNIVATPKLA